MKQIAYLLAGAALTAAAIGGFEVSAANANTPLQQGWWTSSNPGSVPEAGVAPPQPPSDVPAKGLLIEGGSSSTTGAANSAPTAFAALVYEIPDGATVGKLTLTVTSRSATTPTTTLELCPLDNAGINAEQGGPMGDAPSFSCRKNTSAGASSGGGTYAFDVSNLVANGNLAVAILPTMPTDRVVFNQPAANALPIQAAPTSELGGSTAGVPASSGPPVTNTAQPGAPTQPSSSASVSNGSSGAVSPVAPAPVASTPAPPASSPSIAAARPGKSSQPRASGSFPANTQFASNTSSGGSAEPWAVGLLIGAVIVGGLLWIAAGRAATRGAAQAT